MTVQHKRGDVANNWSVLSGAPIPLYYVFSVVVTMDRIFEIECRMLTELM